MGPAIDNRAVILFLRSKNINAAEMHRELCTPVYGQNGTPRYEVTM
jgi:hypothetical protein